MGFDVAHVVRTIAIFVDDLAVLLLPDASVHQFLTVAWCANFITFL